MTNAQWDLLRRFMLLCVQAILTPKYSQPFSRELWDSLRRLQGDLELGGTLKTKNLT